MAGDFWRGRREKNIQRKYKGNIKEIQTIRSPQKPAALTNKIWSREKDISQNNKSGMFRRKGNLWGAAEKEKGGPKDKSHHTVRFNVSWGTDSVLPYLISNSE